MTELPERKVAEVTVRQYVRERKAELGWATRMTCVPQSYQLGTRRPGRLVRGVGELSGEQVPLQVFSMRSMASGAAFIVRIIAPRSKPSSKPTSTPSVFLAVCFGLLRYDNLKSAVKRSWRVYRREETALFIAFRSHWRFTSEFCSPYEAHGRVRLILHLFAHVRSESGYPQAMTIAFPAGVRAAVRGMARKGSRPCH